MMTANAGDGWKPEGARPIDRHHRLVRAGLMCRGHRPEDGDYTTFVMREHILTELGETVDTANAAADAFLSRNPTYGGGRDWWAAEIEWERRTFGEASDGRETSQRLDGHVADEGGV